MIIISGDMESLLLSSETRSLFLDDLMELKEFLTWRVYELTREDGKVGDVASCGIMM